MTDFQEVIEAIEEADDRGDKLASLKKWMSLPDSSLDITALKSSVFPLIDGSNGEDRRAEALRIWLSSPKSQISLETFRQDILPALTLEKDQHQQLLSYVLCKPENHEVAETFIKSIIHDSDDNQITMYLKGYYLTQEDKAELIMMWLENTSNDLEEKLLRKMLPYVDMSSSLTSLVAWASKPKVGIERLATVLALIHENDLPFASGAIRRWLDKPENTVDAAALEKVLPTIEAPEDRDTLISKWLEVNKASAGALIKLLHWVSDDKRMLIIENWIMLNKAAPNAEHLSEIIHAEALNYTNKYSLALKFLATIADPELRFQQFVLLVRSDAVFSKYDFEKVFRMFEDAGLNENKLLVLLKQLYPSNESIQADCLINYAKIRHLTRMGKEDPGNLSKMILEFSESLTDAKSCFKLVQLGLKNGLTDKDVLLITKNKLSAQFESLGEILNARCIDCLADGKVDELKEIFGDIPDDFTLRDLFSYYDSRKNLAKFKSMVKPEILQSIKDHYQPSSKSPYISDEDHRAQVVIGLEPLPEMMTLSRYLKSKLTAIPPISGSMARLDESDPILMKFKMLLSKGDKATRSDIVDFFKLMTGFELESINDQDKLCHLYQTKQTELAYLLSQKDGVKNYLEIVRDIGHGCSANIGTKTNLYLYQSLLEDKIDQVLYAFYSEQIVVPILSSGGDQDLLESSPKGVDLFDRNIITAHLSPPGLVSGLIAEFYWKGKMQANPSELIGQLLDKSECTALYDTLDDLYFDDKNTYLQKEAEVATYLIIRKVMPEVLKSPYIKEFVSNSGKLLGEKPANKNIREF